jgi:hypothetical protein
MCKGELKINTLFVDPFDFDRDGQSDNFERTKEYVYLVEGFSDEDEDEEKF